MSEERLDRIETQLNKSEARLDRIEQDQSKILSLVESTNSRLDRLDQDLRAANQHFEDGVKQWDDRFFQLVKEQGQLARTIIIAAASVVVLSPVLGAAVEIVGRLLTQR